MPNKPASVVIRKTGPFRDLKVEFVRAYLHSVLKETQGVISRATVLADMDRKNFYMLLRQHNIDFDEYRA